MHHTAAPAVDFCTVKLAFQSRIMVVQDKEVMVFERQGEASSVDTCMWLGGVLLPGLTCLSSVANYFHVLCWTPREKGSVEEEIKEKEEAIRQRSSEVQVRFHRLSLVESLYPFPVRSIYG